MQKWKLLVSPLLIAALAAACSDQTESPAGPSGISLRAASNANEGAGGKSSLDLIEEDYASGLVDKENANKYRAYAVWSPGKLPAKYRSNVVGKDGTYSMVQMKRDWDQLSAATRDEILDLEGDGFGTLQDTYVTQHFVLHFTTKGTHAVPSQDANRNGISDFIDAAAASWEEVWNREVGQLGYPAPIGTPAQKFHVYYRDIPYYGYCVPENIVLNTTTPVPQGTASAWIVVENDFYGFPPNDEDVTGQEVIRSGALKVTQAHEFMHAIQFAINVYQSGWLMESHATWAEDAVYDHANDWHWYINRFLRTPDYPLFSRYLYGAAYFQNWLSETRGVDVQRQIWLAAKSATAADAIKNVAFGGSWEGIKEFASAEYLLGISDFTKDGPSVIPTPVNYIRATHTSFPVSVTVGPSTNRLPNRAPWGTGANFVEFTGASGDVTITFDGTDGYAWRAYALATPAAGGPPAVLPITLDAGSAGSITVKGLGTRWAKIVLSPTIADLPGVEVPYSYSASIGSAGAVASN